MMSGIHWYLYHFRNSSLFMFFLAKPSIFILRFAKKYSFCLAKLGKVRGLSWQKLVSPSKILRFAKKRTTVTMFCQTMYSKLPCFAKQCTRSYFVLPNYHLSKHSIIVLSGMKLLLGGRQVMLHQPR